MKDKALKLALDWYDSGHEDREEFQAMIENLLATPVQPVAFEEWHSANYVQTLEKYGDSYKNMHVRNRWQGWLGAKSTPPATQRHWVGLTDERVRQLCGSVPSMKAAVREAEAELKELNA